MFQKWASLVAASLLLLTLAIQYPLTNSFPMGGDAATHITIVNELLDNWSSPQRLLHTLVPSFYPLAYLSFAPARLLPISWLERFIWWMVLGHVLTGLALGWFLYRLAGWPSAATGMAIWALTPITINHHFEDATLPQLWSLVWLLLFFERFLVRSTAGMIIAALAAFFTHALTGVVLGIAIAIAAPSLFVMHYARYLLAATGLGALALVGITVGRSVYFLNTFPRELTNYYFGDLLSSSFSIWLALALIGLVWLLREQARLGWPQKIMLLSFAFVSFITAFNHWFGAGFLMNRFHSYFILSVVMMAALPLPVLLKKVFPTAWRRVTFVVVLFASLALTTWYHNQRVYRYYVSHQGR